MPSATWPSSTPAPKTKTGPGSPRTPPATSASPSPTPPTAPASSPCRVPAPRRSCRSSPAPHSPRSPTTTASPDVVAGIDSLLSRTGYTGEDGFELYCAAQSVATLWDALLDAGKPFGLLPAGLGARDTLRLEAGYCLYDHELTDEITPLEAGLAWTVKLNKSADFIGRAALEAEKRDGLPRKLVGLELRDRGVPRGHYPILRDGERIGDVTSGTLGPTLGHPVAMGYVPPDAAAPGTALAVEIRGKPVPAEVVPLPFYKRPNDPPWSTVDSPRPRQGPAETRTLPPIQTRVEGRDISRPSSP